MARRGRLRLDSRAVNRALVVAATPSLLKAAQLVEKELPPGYKTAIEVDTDRNGRPRSMIAIAEPKGLAAQAKHGLLTRAAAAVGLDIHRYPIRGA